jgi:GT2 family glycosyltransferase
VNDASPDAAINDYLAGVGKDRRVELLTNDTNLGFVGSVNRALAGIPRGDILLLNADTIVPDNFVDRLAAAAHSSPGIGTVTPLSNNGEFTSFPIANTAKPLPPLAEMAALDRIAAQANAGRIVTIPNGIGFCLYVTRACLDSVGALSNRYHRGYLEDVDFCLRARECGFRNVCAPFVYVGHAGSRSFGKGKRSLVVRNLAIIERRLSMWAMPGRAHSAKGSGRWLFAISPLSSAGFRTIAPNAPRLSQLIRCTSHGRRSSARCHPRTMRHVLS